MACKDFGEVKRVLRRRAGVVDGSLGLEGFQDLGDLGLDELELTTLVVETWYWYSCRHGDGLLPEQGTVHSSSTQVNSPSSVVKSKVSTCMGCDSLEKALLPAAVRDLGRRGIWDPSSAFNWAESVGASREV